MYPYPHFLVIGAAKSGTTSIHEYLRQHPAITLPIQKETHFFVFNKEGERPEPGYMGRKFDSYTDNWIDYQKSFEQKEKMKVFGEVCPSYLFFPNAVDNIKQAIPDVKILAILRNPVDRFLSNAKYYEVRHGDLGFTDQASVITESENNIDILRLLSYGKYYSHLVGFYDRFPKENLKVFLYEDMLSDPQKLMNDILVHIDLPEYTFNVNQRFNVTGEPKLPIIYKTLIRNRLTSPIRKLLPSKIYQKVRSTAERLFFKKDNSSQIEYKGALIDYYKEDIEKLSVLIDRDLEQWLG